MPLKLKQYSKQNGIILIFKNVIVFKTFKVITTIKYSTFLLILHFQPKIAEYSVSLFNWHAGFLSVNQAKVSPIQVCPNCRT